MAEMLVAAFPNRDDADEAIDELRGAGYPQEDISVIAQQGEASVLRETRPRGEGGSDVGSGAVTGGLTGGIAGLLLGASGIIILGPIAALLGMGGILGTTITGAVIGALTGGLVAALVDLGIPEEQAREYDQIVRDGGAILAVPVHDLRKDNIRRILEDNGAEGTSEVPLRERAARV